MRHRILVTFALLLAGLTLACADPPTQSEPQAQAQTQSDLDGEESEAASKPSEPAWIVFQSARSGRGDLFAVDPATGETKLVFGTELGEGGVRYDASRGRLVHQRFEEDPERVMLASGDEDLFVDPNGDTPPSWSPTGEWIVYVASRDGQEDLYLAQPDGTGEIQLTDDAEIDRYPVWSPDGQRIAFVRRTETGWDLFTISPEAGATPERLTNLGEYAGHPDWSPDGTSIAFDRLYFGQAEIVVLDVETGDIRRLTDRASNDMAPAWSPDSRVVAFAGEPEGSNNWDLWTVDIESLEITRLTTEEGYDGRPVYVPASVLER